MRPVVLLARARPGLPRGAPPRRRPRSGSLLPRRCAYLSSFCESPARDPLRTLSAPPPHRPATDNDPLHPTLTPRVLLRVRQPVSAAGGAGLLRPRPADPGHDAQARPGPRRDARGHPHRPVPPLRLPGGDPPQRVLGVGVPGHRLPRQPLRAGGTGGDRGDAGDDLREGPLRATGAAGGAGGVPVAARAAAEGGAARPHAAAEGGRRRRRGHGRGVRQQPPRRRGEPQPPLGAPTRHHRPTHPSLLSASLPQARSPLTRTRLRTRPRRPPAQSKKGRRSRSRAPGVSSQKPIESPELLRLVAISSVEFRGFAPPHRHPTSSCLADTRVSKLLAQSALTVADCLAFSRRHLAQVFPSTSRASSSNYDPCPAWEAGLQMASLNFQDPGRANHVNAAKFRGNGGCGCGRFRLRFSPLFSSFCLPLPPAPPPLSRRRLATVYTS